MIWKRIIVTFFILLFAFGLGFFIYKSEPRLNSNFENEKIFLKNKPFRLGLDLSGGSHLVYNADVSQVPLGEVGSSMESLRDVIERRVNLFGVSEPLIQIQEASFVSGGEYKLIVDLPQITDVEKATEMIGQTPLLDFRTQGVDVDSAQNVKVGEDGNLVLDMESSFITTGLTGRFLKKAILEFNSNTNQPVIRLQFNDEGKKLFAQITKENIGKIVAIYLDGSPLSMPVVQEEIPDGEAVISGTFTPQEAKQLVGRLNSGALPVPISLVSKQVIGATLGERAINDGVRATIIGFLLVSAFLILWYRLPGFLASVALIIFVLIILTLFKIIPVTLTTAGIAGFIISMGVAVDANVLIFERIKEEIKNGRNLGDAIEQGFSRAWFSIRDSNISSLIVSVILFWFGTSLIKGFALTLGIGVLVSMFCSLFITKRFLALFLSSKDGKILKFLFSSGFSK